MRTAILRHYTYNPVQQESGWYWRPVILVSQGINFWRIWSIREPFTRVIAKKSAREQVE